MAGHIAARGAGTWRLFVDGPRDVVTGRRRQITRTFHGSRKQAEKELAHLVVEVERGAHDGRAGTVDQLFAQWLAVAQHEKSTAMTNATCYQNYVRPALGSRTVRKLRPLELQKFYRDLLERGGQAGGPLSPNTVRRVHQMLHRALQEAVRWGWIVSNPAHGIDLPKVEERQQRAPTPAEVGTLLAEAASKDPDWACALLVSADTGCRRGELCALRWSAIDLERGAVTIKRALGQAADGLYEKSTKTRQQRIVAIGPGTLAELRKRRLRAEQAAGGMLDADAFVFSNDPRGQVPWQPHSVTNKFTRLRDRLALRHVRLHDLRHFCATYLLDAGLPAGEVARRLGHSRTSTTFDIYGHVVDGRDVRAAAVLAELLPPGF